MSYSHIKERFLRDIAEHKMEVVLNNGVHRHLSFRKPGSSCYSFSIVTWPGYLAISGDMGANIFSRTFDMLEFFRSSGDRHDFNINPHYWQEKLQCAREEAKTFSRDLLNEEVKRTLEQYFEDYVDSSDDDYAENLEKMNSFKAAVIRHIDDSIEYDDVSHAYSVFNNFLTEDLDLPFELEDAPDFFKEFNFGEDISSTSWMEFTHHYIWHCFAIAYAVAEYDKFMAATPAPEENHKSGE